MLPLQLAAAPLLSSRPAPPPLTEETIRAIDTIPLYSDRWPPDAIKRLVEHWEAGTETGSICQILTEEYPGRTFSRQVILSKLAHLRSLGVPVSYRGNHAKENQNHAPSPERLKDIRPKIEALLRNSTIRLTAIAEQFRVPWETVDMIARALEIDLKGRMNANRRGSTLLRPRQSDANNLPQDTAIAGLLARSEKLDAAIQDPLVGGQLPLACRWVIGDPAAPGWCYCNRPLAGTPGSRLWCADHHARVYTPREAKTKRSK